MCRDRPGFPAPRLPQVAGMSHRAWKMSVDWPWAFRPAYFAADQFMLINSLRYSFPAQKEFCLERFL
jgi:hypothetical protein